MIGGGAADRAAAFLIASVVSSIHAELVRGDS
jgi:hypothetical protein